MRHRSAASAPRHRAGPHQEGSLNQVTFVGSFPRADFSVQPPLPEVAFIGRSNVGKSSLINAVVGRKAIARTSKTPGKTRECNVYRIDDSLYLVDLPGYGYAQVSKTERKRLGDLIDRYLSDRKELTGVVWLLDIRRDLSADDEQIGQVLTRRGAPVLAVLTKADKLSKGRQAERAAAVAGQLGWDREDVLVTSSTKKIGIEDLVDSIEALRST